MMPMSFVYDEEQELSPNEFVRDDITFRGWALSPRGLMAFADGESVKNLTSLPDGVVTLYGVWEGDVVAVKVGEYVKAPLSVLGYDVPTDGTTPYSVTAYGLPAGLKLVGNKAVTKKVGKKTVVVTPANVEWWIEGVPTAELDFFTNPPYLVITANGRTEPYALPLEVKAQEVTELDDLAIGQSMNEQFYLLGVTNGWTVSGLPTGLKYTAKLLTTKKKVGKKTVVTTNALPYSVYGKTTKAGLFTITAKKKVGAFYETMKYRVLVRPAAVDTEMFGDLPTNLVTMAYVPVAWDLAEGGSGRLGEAALPGEDDGEGGHAGRVTLPAVPTVAKVAGLPGGVAFASANVYSDKKKTKLKQYGQTIVGTPTKPGTYVVPFTKNVKSGKKTVAKTAQILWTVEPNDAKVELGFNTAGGVIENGVVGLDYGDLLAFSATSNATVTASGLPAGIKLVKLEDGAYAFTGFTAKAGTYLVTVKATLNGKTVTQRLALKVEGLPDWAKGTYNGCVWGTGNGEGGTGGTNGLATVTVSVAGKISGKFYEGGSNWTFSAACYTDGRARSPSGPQSQASGSQNDSDAGGSASRPYQFICTNVVAKYAYKVKSGKKTVTKYVTRTFTLTVAEAGTRDACPYRGVATMVEDCGRLGEAALPGEAGTMIEAWQNLWGSAYKAVGKKLFYTSKKKPYKTFTYKGGDDGGHAGRVPLPEGTTLSLKVTTAGAVTATLSYDTGETKKDPKTKKTVKVIYKATCQSVVVPQVAADAEPFVGEVPLYFAPSPASKFPGYAGTVTFSE